LYIIVKPDFITDLNYYFELGDRHSMRLKFVPDFSTISKAHFSTGSFDHFHVIKPRHEPLQNDYNRLVKEFDLVLVFLSSFFYFVLVVSYFGFASGIVVKAPFYSNNGELEKK
jgi:putative colanic acid biosynthesis UDP-glucose lipid carrier transferase